MEVSFLLVPKTGSFNVGAIEAHLGSLSPVAFKDTRSNPNPKRSSNRWLVCGERLSARATKLRMDAGEEGSLGAGVFALATDGIHVWQGAGKSVLQQVRGVVEFIATQQQVRIFNEESVEVTDQGIAGLYA